MRGQSKLTYNITATDFSTELGNRFSYFHFNFSTDNWIRVVQKGDITISISFLKGMEILESKAIHKPNQKIYFKALCLSPLYSASFTDKSGKILRTKNYGGKEIMVNYGKGWQYSEKELSEKWSQEKTDFFRKIEFGNLDFSGLEEDLSTLFFNKMTRGGASPHENMEEDNEIKKSTTFLIPKKPFYGQEFETPVDTTSNNLDVSSEEQGSNFSPEKGNFNSSSFSPNPEKMDSSHEKLLMTDRPNVLKLNLTNFVIGGLTFNYERVLSPATSFALNIGYLRPQRPFSALSDWLSVKKKDPASFAGMNVTLEYRFYRKKRLAPVGFYIAPYFRYAIHHIDYYTEIKNNFTKVNARLLSAGFGGQAGFQWFLRDRFSFEWGLIGLAVQSFKFTADFRPADAELDLEEIETELRRKIQDSPLPDKLEFISDENILKVKLPFLFGAVRTYFSVGYQF